jgi:hypothetical protein
MGPIRTRALVVFLMGSMMVPEALEYRVIGENKETLSLTWAFLIVMSIWVSWVPPLVSTGAILSAMTLAARETKKDRKIHNATDARAEVAMFLNNIENRMDRPSQKEM